MPDLQAAREPYHSCIADSAAAAAPTRLCLQVFITPMPLLRLMAACGMPHLKNLNEAVAIMRAAMLDVIQVGLWAGGFYGRD